MTTRIPVMMLVSIAFGSLAVVVGLLISFHAGTAGGATMAGLSIAQFFVVLAVTRVIALIRRPPGFDEPADLAVT